MVGKAWQQVEAVGIYLITFISQQEEEKVNWKKDEAVNFKN